MTRFVSAIDIATTVRTGKKTAVSIIEDTLNILHNQDCEINSTTHLFHEESLEKAKQIDRDREAGKPLPILAGVPFGVKDLYDIVGHTTTAGSVVLKDNPPAQQDAVIVERLKNAGAIPVATLNMDEFAYGFATVNSHYGTTRNPHDLNCLAGGSSGGSAAAVAAGFLPFTLGSDTNGSIRVPASLCGVWGLKPTFGRLSRKGVYPFSASLDVAGHFAGSLDDLITTFHVMDGSLPDTEPEYSSLRIGRLGGWFAENLSSNVEMAINRICSYLNVTKTIELPKVQNARAASFLITAAEGGNLHLPRLKEKAGQYDPATRDRLLAGALLPATTYLQAQRFRNWFRNKIHNIFKEVDILIAPAVMSEAPQLDQPTVIVNGQSVSARANLGLYTQPLSLPGLPVLCVPLLNTQSLPIGLQLIAAPRKESILFSVARHLQNDGLVGRVPIK